MEHLVRWKPIVAGTAAMEGESSSDYRYHNTSPERLNLANYVLHPSQRQHETVIHENMVMQELVLVAQRRMDGPRDDVRSLEVCLMLRRTKKVPESRAFLWYTE